jgi:hypothetical protein
MSQENRVKIGRDNYKTTDGVPHSVEPATPFQTVGSGSPSTLNFNSSVILLSNGASQSYAILEANAPGNIIKVGQKVTIRTLAGTNVATIKPTPSQLTTGATANIVYSQPGVLVTGSGGIVITGLGSVTLRYLGNNTFNVVDYSFGASGSVAFS